MGSISEPVQQISAEVCEESEADTEKPGAEENSSAAEEGKGNLTVVV